jgi:2-desacetyl-2-hydroxyethyl bacteriochlorophyllide A dehydrogenase
MQAGVFHQPGSLTVQDMPEPVVGPQDVLIAVQSAGICGTDIHILKGEYEAQYPLIPGHEFSGVVAAVGTAVKRFQPGDRVTADPNVPCGRCYFCQRNEPNQCRDLRAIGVTGNGGFARYVVAPEGNVFPIGDLAFDAAALIEPLACVVWGLKQVEIQAGDSLLLFGAGPMGCLLLQAARCAGATHITVVDPVAWRLDLARSLGATDAFTPGDHLGAALEKLEPYGYDVVVDATGVPAVLEAAFAYIKPRGKFWVFGVTPTGTQVRIPSYEVFRKDLKIIGSFAVNRTFPQAITLIQSGAVQVTPLISHRLPLAEFARGFDLAQHDPVRMKVQFTIG